MINPYNNVYDLFSEFGILKRHASQWRLTKDAIFGEILGLPSTGGYMLATDGVRCLIKLWTNDKQLFEGHIDYFVAQRVSQRSEVTLADGTIVGVGAKVSTARRKEQASKITKELMESLLLL